MHTYITPHTYNTYISTLRSLPPTRAAERERESAETESKPAASRARGEYAAAPRELAAAHTGCMCAWIVEKVGAPAGSPDSPRSVRRADVGFSCALARICVSGIFNI